MYCHGSEKTRHPDLLGPPRPISAKLRCPISSRVSRRQWQSVAYFGSCLGERWRLMNCSTCVSCQSFGRRCEMALNAPQLPYCCLILGLWRLCISILLLQVLLG